MEDEVKTSDPSALADRRISQLEAEIAALRFSLSRGGSSSFQDQLEVVVLQLLLGFRSSLVQPPLILQD